jgi:hypothetical protein
MIDRINFTKEDWERIERDWSAFLAGELDRPMVVMETWNMLYAKPSLVLSREFMLEKPISEVLDFYQNQLDRTYYFGDAWPKIFVNHGPGIAAGFLGAEVTGMPEQGTVWFGLEKPVPLEELHLKFDPDNQWWKRVEGITRQAVERWGNKISMAHTDIGGNLDILAAFRSSQNLLYDLYDAPGEVERLSAEITKAWLEYYNRLYDIIKPAGRGTSSWACVWSPGRTCMHQSDFCYMISPKMFERFVLPDLDAIFSTMDHAFYHLDGKGQIPHLEMLLSLDSLKGIQWISGGGQPPAEEWPDLLRRIRDGGKFCQVFVTAEGARTIVKELGGKGFILYVIGPRTQESARDFLKTLADEDISRKKSLSG